MNPGYAVHCPHEYRHGFGFPSKARQSCGHPVDQNISSHPLIGVNLPRRGLGLPERLGRAAEPGVLLVLKQQLHGVPELVVQHLQRLPSGDVKTARTRKITRAAWPSLITRAGHRTESRLDHREAWHTETGVAICPEHMDGKWLGRRRFLGTHTAQELVQREGLRRFLLQPEALLHRVMWDLALAAPRYRPRNQFFGRLVLRS